MTRKNKLMIAIAPAVLAVLGGTAVSNYETASRTFTADPSPSDCGHACHVAVKAKDHIFHPYQTR
jgi:hypothetical protein